jgi:prevent-host-death family protein
VRWQLQEAKQKLSEVIEKALQEGPQVVTRRGEEVAVILSMEEFRRLREPRPDFKAFLLGGPDLGMLPLERSLELPREPDL